MRYMSKCRVIYPLVALVLLVTACMSPFGSSSLSKGETANLLAVTSEYNYRNYSAIKAVLEEAAVGHPSIARVHDIGDSWEKTEGLADRDILALKISDNVAVEEDEPEVLIMGLHHAREWPTSELVTALAENLTAGYGVDARISWLVDNRQIWLVPVVNPDGLDYALETDDTWRKNRRLNYDDTYGVDLNRNYNGSENGDPDGLWGGEGSSHNPADQTYCGESPFSEPETQAVRDLVLAHAFEVAIDFHTYGDYVMWPWSFTTELAPDDDDLVRIGGELVALNGYLPMQGIYLYPTTGDSTDWLYGAADIFAYCIEVGNEDVGVWERFHPLEYDTAMSLINENLPVSFELMEIAGDRQERGIEIRHDGASEREYTESGFEIVATVLAERGVNSTALEVTYRVDEGEWTSVPMVLYIGNDTYLATIPSLEIGSIVEYYIYAEDLGGFPLTSPRYAPYEGHSFEVVEGPDMPPIIYHEPRTDESVNDTAFRADRGVSIHALVTDEDMEHVSVSLYHRPLDSSSAFDVVAMLPEGDVDDFLGLVTSGYEYGLEYYIEAQDEQDHITRAPGDAPHSCHAWYNVAPSIHSVLPDESSRLVGCSQIVEISVTVADDYGPTYVVMSVEYALGESYLVGMARVSEAEGVSEWSAEIMTRSLPGTVWLNFTALDGLCSSWLNGTIISVIDPSPLEVDSDVPPSADGSFDIVVTAVPRNATSDMAFRLRMVRPFSLEERVYSFLESSDSSLKAVIPAGSLRGTFTAVVDALIAGQMVWSSEGSTVEVVDLQMPELLSKTVDFSGTSRLLLLEVTASDAYPVKGIVVFRRYVGQVDFSTSDMDLIGSAGNESTWRCWIMVPTDAVLEYYLVISDDAQSRRAPDSPSLYVFNPADGESSWDGELLGLPVWVFVSLVLVEVAVVAVAAFLISRARRP